MKKLIPVLVLAIVLAAVGLVAAQSNLPGSGWKSGQQIQNVGGSSASVAFIAYGVDGTDYDCGQETVPAGGSVTYLTDTDCPVPAGFVGSAVVSADQPIAAIVNVNNKGVGAASGQYRGTDGADVSTSISFPLVKNNHSGRTTTFYVQNASTNTNTITATFAMQDGAVKTKTYNNVPANAMVVVTPSDAGVASGQGQVGSLSVTGTQPLAGSSLEHEANAAVAQNLQASKAFTPSDYDTTFYCPLVRNAHTSKAQTTGVQVQNVSGSSQSVTITYATGQTNSATVADGASHTFFTPNDLPAGTLTSATVTGAGDIVAVVNDKGNNTANPQRVTTYACFGAGSATDSISIPLAKENLGGATTGLQVQNVGGGPMTCEATYTHSGGSVIVKNTAAVAVGASATFNAVYTNPTSITAVSGSPASLNGTNNGVVISCNQLAVAIANESSISGTIQDTKNYEGFNN
jgi:hypothetical protein